MVEGRGDAARRRCAATARFSAAHEWKFKWMLRTQKAVPRVPPRLLAAALRGMERKSFVDWSFGHYLRIAPPVVRGRAAPATRREARDQAPVAA